MLHYHKCVKFIVSRMVGGRGQIREMSKLFLSRASLVAQLVKNLLQACNTGDPALIPGSGRSPGEEMCYPAQYSWVSLVSQRVKNPPAMWETSVRSLGWEDLLEEGIATHSTILAWRIPMDREAWWATVHGVTKSRSNEQLSTAQQQSKTCNYDHNR